MIVRIVSTILTLLLFSSIRAEPSLCTPSVESMTTLQKNDSGLVETRDQDGVGFCYAYSAADMIEQWLRKNGELEPNEHLSGLGLALQSEQYRFIRKSALAEAKKILDKKDPSITETKVKEQSRVMKKLSNLQEKFESIQEDFRRKSPHYPTLLELKKEKGKSEEYKKLYREIWKNIEFSKAYLELILPVEKEIEELDKINSYLFFLISYLRFPLPKDSTELDSGGFVKDSINDYFPDFCFESEISSFDNKVSALLLEVLKKSKDDLSEPTDYNDAINCLLATPYNESLKDDCSTKEFIRSIFPGLSTLSDEFLDTIIENSKFDGNLIGELIKKSCTIKPYSKRPILLNPKIDEKLPLKNSEDLFIIIDQSLARGITATVSYRSQILLKEDHLELKEGEPNDHHESLITGSAEACGKKYYILRNTWGKESCKEKVATYEHGEEKNKLIAPYQTQLLECDKALTIKGENLFKKEKCLDDACIEKKRRFMSDGFKACEETFKKKTEQILTVPFFCDKDGNFIIEKSYLKKGVYATTTIAN